LSRDDYNNLTITDIRDSRVEPHQSYQKTAFGEALALKLAKQGIQRQ
jgi:hypothetical protein